MYGVIQHLTTNWTNRKNMLMLLLPLQQDRKCCITVYAMFMLMTGAGIQGEVCEGLLVGVRFIMSMHTHTYVRYYHSILLIDFYLQSCNQSPIGHVKGELPKCHILLCDAGGFKPFLLLNCGGPILLATVNVRNEQLHLHNSTIPRNKMIDLGTLLDRYNRTLFAFYELIDFFCLILFFPSFFAAVQLFNSQPPHESSIRKVAQCPP